MTNDEFRAAAKKEYGSEGRIEIDGNAIVSRGNDYGAYIAAWVWIADDHPSEEDEE